MKRTAADKSSDEEGGYENETRSGGLEWDVTDESHHHVSPPIQCVACTGVPKLSYFARPLKAKMIPKAGEQWRLFTLEERVGAFVQVL